MSTEPKYTHHSLNVHSTEKVAAAEVSARVEIEIEFKEPLWSGPGTVEYSIDDMVGVYCKTYSDAIWFEHAFEWRRGEGSKGGQAE